MGHGLANIPNIGTLHSLQDGIDQLPSALFHYPDGANVTSLNPSAMVRLQVQAFLLKTPEFNLLIDGGGAGLSPQLGDSHYALAEAGMTASDIDGVFCTHLHPDHLGGLVEDGRPIFGDAKVWVHQSEIDFWANPDIRACAPPETAQAFDKANEFLAAYTAQINVFTDPIEIIDSVKTVPLDGHTPGHTGLQIGQPEDGVFICADIVHSPELQLMDPDICIGFDIDPEAACATRKRVLDNAAETGRLIAGSHLPDNGIGRIRRNAAGYEFEPANSADA